MRRGDRATLSTGIKQIAVASGGNPLQAPNLQLNDHMLQASPRESCCTMHDSDKQYENTKGSQELELCEQQVSAEASPWRKLEGQNEGPSVDPSKPSRAP